MPVCKSVGLLEEQRRSRLTLFLVVRREQAVEKPALRRETLAKGLLIRRVDCLGRPTARLLWRASILQSEVPVHPCIGDHKRAIDLQRWLRVVLEGESILREKGCFEAGE